MLGAFLNCERPRYNNLEGKLVGIYHIGVVWEFEYLGCLKEVMNLREFEYLVCLKEVMNLRLHLLVN